MPVFNAIVSIDGISTKVSLVAKSEADARRSLLRRGRILSIKRKLLPDLEFGLTPYERYVFLLKVSTMIQAKVSMGRALELMSETFTGNIKRVSKNMSERVNGGMNFIAALEHERRSFPDSIVALVRSGFAAGNAGSALREAADFEQMMQNIQKGSMKDIWTGISYFVMATGLTVATMEYFGPMVMGNPMFDRPGVDVGWIEDVGNIFMWFSIGMLVVIAFLLFLGSIGRQISPTAIDKVIAKIPFYSDLILSKNNYITFYKMALLVKSGVRIEETLSITSTDIGRGSLKSDLKAALENVRKGKPWALAMGTLDPTDRASLMASSDREDIARTFRLMADQFRDLYIARLKTLGPALNLVAALFLSIASGLMFGLTILPMLMLSASM